MLGYAPEPAVRPDERGDVTRFQYLLVKHSGRTVAQGGQIILIAVVVLVFLPQLPRFEPPSSTAAALAFTGGLAIVILGRLLESWGELKSRPTPRR
jgi:hypothetical protein